MGLILDTCISPVLFHSLAASELSCSLGIFTSVDTKISILGSLDSFCTAISRIQNNTLSSVLLVGSQESLSPFYLNRLAALGLLNVNDNGNPSEAIRSFDINAKGMVLGEGAAAIVLESFEAVDKRGGKILAEVKGYGRNNDGKYLFKPEESGKGLQRACSIALKQANCTPDAVLADGSSLPDRDFVEVIGVNAIAKNKKITGIKANIGHMLGATGPSQIASAVMAVNQVSII